MSVGDRSPAVEHSLARALPGVQRAASPTWHWQGVFFASDLLALSIVAYLNRDVPLVLLALYVPLVLALFWLEGLYPTTRQVSVLDQGPQALSMISVATMTIFTLSVLLFGWSFDAHNFIQLWLTSATAMFAGRALAMPVRTALARTAPARRTVIIGSGKSALLAAEKIDRGKSLGLELLGFVDDGPRRSVRGREEPLLGDLDQLNQIIEDYGIETVVVSWLKRGHHETLRILYRSEPKVEVLLLPRFFEYLSAGVRIDALGNLPVLRLQSRRIEGLSALAKRLEDLLLAGGLALLAAPLFPLIAVAIKLDSRGPVIYKSGRVGRGFKPFVQYKFRTMHVGADHDKEIIDVMKDQSARGWKLKDDPRITRVGRLLRRTSLDELPQLINILKGEMSFVGPRPALVGELGQYEEWQRKRQSVRPGLTGLWQVSGRSELPFDERIWLDFLYIDTWSLWLDFKIIMRTIGAVLTARGAY